MRSRTASILLIALACAGQPAWGQARLETETGSLIRQPRQARIPDKIGLSDAERGRVAAEEFADCVVERRKDDVAQLLGALYGSADERRALKRMAVDRCLFSGQLTMPSSLMRGAVFRSLYKKDFGDRSPGLAPAAPNYSVYVNDPTSNGGAVQILMLDFASCVIRADVNGARGLLLAQAASEKETQAFSSLVPFMGACFPKGKSAQLSKSTVMAVIAEAMYREAQAGMTDTTPSGKM